MTSGQPIGKREASDHAELESHWLGLPLGTPKIGGWALGRGWVKGQCRLRTVRNSQKRHQEHETTLTF
jgi:hypothetical protein